MLSESMTDSQAETALFDAMQADQGKTAYGESALEQPAPAPAEQAAEVTPEVEAQDGATVEEIDSFTKLDPTAIPEELKPWYQSMQADYTRKTQQLSEVRKQYESLGEIDPDQTRAALNLFQQLQDPQSAVAFHAQLTNTLTNLGLTPAQAQAVATEQVQAAAQETPGFEDDPESYLRSELESVKQQYESLSQTIQAQQDEAQRAQFETALLGEIQRQESLIRDTNPHYNDSDLDAIYKLAAFHEGSLLDAQSSYEDIVTERVNRLMANKAGAANNAAAAPLATPGMASEAPSFGDDLEAAHRAAQEQLRQILAADA